MSDQMYNGWTNYATWRVNLEMFDGYDPEGTFVTAEAIADMADDLLTMDGTREGLAVDYARAFLNNVDWQEIADEVNGAFDLTDPEEEDDDFTTTEE
jgi:hypothetical protein